MAAKVVRQAVGARVQLRVGQAEILPHQCLPVRPGAELRLELFDLALADGARGQQGLVARHLLARGAIDAVAGARVGWKRDQKFS